MRIDNKLACVLVGFSLLVAACSSAAGDASPTPQPESVLTAAAQTAQAQLTELAKPKPTSTSSPLPAETIPPLPTDSAALGTDLSASPDPDTAGVITPTPATGGVDQGSGPLDHHRPAAGAARARSRLPAQPVHRSDPAARARHARRHARGEFRCRHRREPHAGLAAEWHAARPARAAALRTGADFRRGHRLGGRQRTGIALAALSHALRA